ncbi:DHHW family protein [Clostridium sp.]|uniref:DHHW family protein n=1 Tax=Clostridium sp. TaxID=1506 RepID=UPI0025C20780|nr:DHHW family protein [Clostridium sp.]MCI9304767.1 hypothetical protein [Clostridium sp.]
MKLEVGYKVKSDNRSKYKNFSSYINVGAFFLILAIFLGFSFFMNNGGYSEYEKRNLKEFPKIANTTIEKFFSGEYFKEIDSFYNDNFPFRDTFLNIANKIDELKGNRKDEIKIY